MLAIVSKRGSPPDRKRRVHAKSRKGCGNCKLRGVKCDETRPRCAKCKSYGVSCDYDGGCKSSLDLAAQGSFQVDLLSAVPTEQVISFDRVACSQEHGYNNGIGYTSGSEDLPAITKPLTTTSNYWIDDHLGTPWSPISTNAAITTMINDSLQSESLSLDSHLGAGSPSWSSCPSWEFSQVHLEILNRFQTRTALTIGDYRMAPAYRDIVCQLALKHPFLMHMLIGLTLMHDADLSLPHSLVLAAKHQHTSLQHWDAATTQFHSILAQPIPPSYRDAIWATGVHLGAASFWYVESTDPTQCWPLKPDEPNDLSWMKLGEGKRHLWRIADPTRPDSLFSTVLKQRPLNSPPEWMEGNDTSSVPEAVKRVFGINEGSTKESNVYFLPVLILSRIQHLRLTHQSCLDFLYFTAFITPEFMVLLEVKDPYAVFLLGWWFKMVADGRLWWMARRAKVEGEAVRIWLQGENEGLADLLESLDRRVVDEGEDGCRSAVEPMWEHALAWKTERPAVEVNWVLDSRGTILSSA